MKTGVTRLNRLFRIVVELQFILDYHIECPNKSSQGCLNLSLKPDLLFHGDIVTDSEWSSIYSEKCNETEILSASNRIEKTEANYENQFMIFLLEEIILGTLIISTNSIIQRN